MNVGKVMPVYFNWQNEEDLIGEAELLEYLEEELSFTNEEEGDEIVIYSGVRWKVKILKSNIYPNGFEKRVSIRKELYRGDRNRISEFTTYKSENDVILDNLWEDDMDL